MLCDYEIPKHFHLSRRIYFSQFLPLPQTLILAAGLNRIIELYDAYPPVSGCFSHGECPKGSFMLKCTPVLYVSGLVTVPLCGQTALCLSVYHPWIFGLFLPTQPIPEVLGVVRALQGWAAQSCRLVSQSPVNTQVSVSAKCVTTCCLFSSFQTSVAFPFISTFFSWGS